MPSFIKQQLHSVWQFTCMLRRKLTLEFFLNSFNVSTDPEVRGTVFKNTKTILLPLELARNILRTENAVSPIADSVRVIVSHPFLGDLKPFGFHRAGVDWERPVNEWGNQNKSAVAKFSPHPQMLQFQSIIALQNS
ncbi:hypothetical protein PoB_002182900 [Plakobranchus ocellatus]|uniref:Uncharacterized protein n=1 Tax=Plakobranchus ocellatus TaxID=259542 RepID=A0AAV3ZJ25_9GAST|nr:hypothetical protein PoB_002182900 [Plakobranchus ocellatus]